MVRVFANYIIWFVFLASIFIYFFKSDSNLSWKKIFPKVVIAAIVVNMSWFLLAALIDISSIFILAFWWLANQVKGVVAKVEKTENKSFNMLPLIIDTDGTGFIYVKLKDTKYYPCIFKVLTWWKVDTKPANPPCFTFYGWTFKIYKNKKSKWEVSDPWFIRIKASSVGVFMSLFRYLNVDFFVTNTTSSTNLALLYFVKFLLFFVLLVPFVLLVIILFIRLIILWIVIPFSPLILWLYTLWLLPWEWKTKFKDILGLIFQPAYVMFMMAIWFLFIQAVYVMIPSKNWGTDKLQTDKIMKTFKITEEGDKIIIDNSIVIAGDKNTNWAEENMWTAREIVQYFFWLLANMIAAFVLWTLVFVAFKSSKFTEKIATSVDTYVKKTIETAPIIPVAGWQSIASLWTTWSQIRKYPEQRAAQQTAKLRDAFKDENKS